MLGSRGVSLIFTRVAGEAGGEQGGASVEPCGRRQRFLPGAAESELGQCHGEPTAACLSPAAPFSMSVPEGSLRRSQA